MKLQCLCRRLPWRPSVRFKSIESPAEVTTSYFNITPTTKTEVVAHDIKAASLTKALYIDTLPPNISSDSENTEFHSTFKKTIFETFFFEPFERQVRDKQEAIMPKRLRDQLRFQSKMKHASKDRKNHISIVQGIHIQILRYLMAKADHEKIKLCNDVQPYFEFPFKRKLPDYKRPQDFLINGFLGYSILSDRPAMPLFSKEQCLQTVDHDIEWTDVIRTTLDINQNYVLENLHGVKTVQHLPSHPYLRVILDVGAPSEWANNARARGIYFLFSRLANEAIRDGNIIGKELDEPKVGVYISCSGYSYHFVFYQLNTLALQDDAGIKNLAWGYSVDNITTPVEPQKMVKPENLLGPELLNRVCNYIKACLMYDIPRNDVFVK